MKLVQDEDSKNIYWLSFNYSSNEECRITVYYCATQTSNREGLPLYLLIPPSLPAAVSTKVESGINAKFEKNEKFCFNVEDYNEMPLFNWTHSYYPWVITIDPTATPKTAKDGITDHQSLLTYCQFYLDKKNNFLNIRPVKQVLVAFEMAFNLQQIYGITDALEEKQNELGMIAGVDYDDSDPSHTCVIWISEEKNTVVMPCGHLCVCKDCAIAISKQTTPDCPVWRKKVTSFVPLNIQSIKKMETFNKTMRGEKSHKTSKGSEEVKQGEIV